MTAAATVAFDKIYTSVYNARRLDLISARQICDAYEAINEMLVKASNGYTRICLSCTGKWYRKYPSGLREETVW